MKPSTYAIGVIAGGALLVAGAAQATTLSANQMTADNEFTAYISTSADNTGGTIIGGPDTDWMTFSAFSTLLTPGVTNYLHIEVFNLGGGSFTDEPPSFGGNPGALLGRFLLDDTGFRFANGLQELLTDTVNWVVSDTGFGVDLETPVSLGSNDGTFIWNVNTNGGNPFAEVPEEAEFIWSDNFCTDCSVYFTAAITPNDVPEPATLGLLGMALLGLGAAQRRRSRANA